MKGTLVIGSTVADVIISIPHLPQTGEDLNITSQIQRLGGCAFNVSEILNLIGTPYMLCSPVGSGLYGDFVANELEKRGIPCFIRLDTIPNGCCYCIVETGGERTFISKHGAEYLFSQSWMDKVDSSNFDSVYICGLEIEESTGDEIIHYLEKHPEYKVFFAPGARLCQIPRWRLYEIFKMSPVFHLNEIEALSLTKEDDVTTAAVLLNKRTNNDVIITLGDRGSYCYNSSTGKGCFIDGYPTEVCDTIGAGDAHLGAIIAYTKLGYTIEEAVDRANKIASAVVSVIGASLPQEIFKKAISSFN